MKTILQATGLCKEYPIGKNQTQTILHNIDLSIEQGEFVVVMGTSGSGKSTLPYNISGMEQPTSGRVELLGRELTGLSEAALARLRLNNVGFVFQQSNLLRNLNLADNILLPAYRSDNDSRRAINRRGETLMKHLGIWELADKDITQASGGQLQRVAVCRALINNPDILFGDEPTGVLNSHATEEVMDILGEINASGTTILLVTHDPKVAARASRVLYMDDGCIVSELEIGTFHNDDNTRTEKINHWLQEQGF